MTRGDRLRADPFSSSQPGNCDGYFTESAGFAATGPSSDAARVVPGFKSTRLAERQAARKASSKANWREIAASSSFTASRPSAICSRIPEVDPTRT